MPPSESLAVNEYLRRRSLLPIYRIDIDGHAIPAPVMSTEDAHALVSLSRTNTMRDYPNRESRFKNA